MPWNKLRNTLIARGYWDEAGDGTEGGAGGGATGEPAGEGGDATGEGEGKEGEGEKKPVPKKPSDAEAKLLKENMEKKKTIADLKAALAKFEGIDPEAVRTLLSQEEQRKVKELEDKGQWDALKKQMTEAQAKIVGEKDAKLKEQSDLLTGLQATIAELTVGNSFGTSSYIANELGLPVSKVRKLYGPNFEFVEGKVVGYDKPAGEKNRTMLVGEDGEALDFDAALQRLVEGDPDKDHLLKSRIKPGAGSSTEKPGLVDDKQKVELKGVDRIAAAHLARSKKKQ